jgi:hypothetical protein
MQTGSIKISELNPFTSSIQAEDFIPLVDSSSMTTFRAGLGQIFGSSFSGVSSSLFASSSVWATSASFASRSISASYSLSSSFATTANKVNLSQQVSYIPQWNGNAANSNLSTYETFMVYTGSRLILDYDHATAIGWYASSSNYLDGLLPSNGGWYRNGGVFTIYPIIGAAFIGADQKAWLYGTSSVNNTNQFYSGSGAWITIPTGSGAMSSSLNNRWVRIAAVSYGVELRPAAFAQSMRAMMGTVRIDARTTVAGTNAQNCIEFDMWQQLWSGVIKADVKYSDNYGVKIVDKIRICRSVVSGSTIYDPHMYIDIHVNNMNVNDIDLYLGLKSLGGSHIRFLENPTWSPIEPVDTGSLPAGPSRLEFVPNIGSYYWIYDNDIAPACRDYIISGQRVRIDPRNSTITESRRAYYDLEVSGTIGCDALYVRNSAGQDGTFVVYEPSAATWLYQRFSKGLLIQSGSAAAPSTGSVTILGNNPIGTIIDWAGYNSSSLSSSGWFMCDGQWFSSALFPDAFTALGGTNNPWGNGSPGSGWNAGNSTFKIPDLCKRATVGSSVVGATVTNYKIRVGDTGGNEDYMSNHVHFFGTTIGTVGVYQWAADGDSTSGVAMDASRTFEAGVTRYATIGGASGGWQGSAIWRDNIMNAGKKWQLVTSYPYLDGGGSSEQVPPYAVVFKLIRLR